MAKDVEFSISVVGDYTGETFRGTFRALKRLSHRAQLVKDQRRRDLLGADPDHATPRAKNQADIFSELSVRLVDAPNWWTDADNGLDLEDDNVIVAIHEKVVQIANEAVEAVRKQGEEAKKDLKKVSEEGA